VSLLGYVLALMLDHGTLLTKRAASCSATNRILALTLFPVYAAASLTNHAESGYLLNSVSAYSRLLSQEGIMRTPNVALFVITVVLAIIALLEHFAVPLAIPAMPSLSIPSIEIPNPTSGYAFWVMFLAWLLLAIGSLLPKRSAAPKLRPAPQPQS
jgi:hypothetical protein